HPLARALVGYARDPGIEIRPAAAFQILPGKGATGRFDGQEYWLGSHRYLEERGQETPEIHERLAEVSRAARTAVVVCTADHVCGLIAVADEVRGEAKALVQALRDAGIQRIVILTGDNRGTAEAIGSETRPDQ